jgi:hypothetical protein
LLAFAAALRATTEPGTRLAFEKATPLRTRPSIPPPRSRRMLLSVGVSLIVAGVGLLGTAAVLRAKTSPRARAATEDAVRVLGPTAAPPPMGRLTITSMDPNAVLTVGSERFLLPITLERPIGARLPARLESQENQQPIVVELAFLDPDGKLAVSPGPKPQEVQPEEENVEGGGQADRRRRSRSRDDAPKHYKRKKLVVDPASDRMDDSLMIPAKDAGVGGDKTHPPRDGGTAGDHAFDRIILPAEFREEPRRRTIGPLETDL